MTRPKTHLWQNLLNVAICTEPIMTMYVGHVWYNRIAIAVIYSTQICMRTSVCCVAYVFAMLSLDAPFSSVRFDLRFYVNPTNWQMRTLTTKISEQSSTQL